MAERVNQSWFIDTNIVLRFLLADHPEHSPRARKLFETAAAGQIHLWFSDTVVFETVFVLEKRFGLDRERIQFFVTRLLSMPGVSHHGAAPIEDVLNLFVDIRKLSFADCFHAVLAKASPGATIVTFDREFDRVIGLTRLEPPGLMEPQ
jgi:predicted nucleic acid-binding protein